jgi:hypothetical protein
MVESIHSVTAIGEPYLVEDGYNTVATVDLLVSPPITLGREIIALITDSSSDDSVDAPFAISESGRSKHYSHLTIKISEHGTTEARKAVITDQANQAKERATRYIKAFGNPITMAAALDELRTSHITENNNNN